ncbi:MFS general substrate transporter [Trichoderma asperelloides]|nr:MFS general substrate transporter [Trichoderma asperelloides]
MRPNYHKITIPTLRTANNPVNANTDTQENSSPTLFSFIWVSLFLLAIAVSLVGQTIVSYQPYALSEFNAHSMLSVIGTVQYILYAIVKPSLARTANIWGLLEAFIISSIAILIGFAINAASQNLGTDITTLENRSILGSLVLSPTIFTSWIGAPIVSAMVPEKWRWAIIFPVVSMPLLISLWRYLRRSIESKMTSSRSEMKTSLTLVLLPMTLSTSPFQLWTSPAKLTMIIIGGCCFIAFTLYEIHVSSHPIVPFKLAKDRTVAAGCMVQFALYLSYYIWAPYFFSFIVIVNNQSAKAATDITASQVVATAVTGLHAAFIIKLTGVYKWAILLGMILKLIGAGLMLRYSSMHASIVQILFGQLISGAGTGMISIIAQTAVQAVTEHQDVASVTTLYEVSGAVGGAIGNALSGIIWTALLLPRLRINLPASAQSAAIE